MVSKLIRSGLSLSMFVLLLGCGGADSDSTTDEEVSVAEDITYNEQSGDLTAEQNRVLLVHNQKRNIHFSDVNLSYSVALERAAQAYANVLAQNGKFEHDPNNHTNGYGENLYAYTKSEPISIEEAMIHWYDDEKPLYNYDDGSCQEAYYESGDQIKCGHYTQVIWQETHEVGCANAQYQTGDFTGGYIYVCKYKKAGNIVGQKPYCSSYSNADIYLNNLSSSLALANHRFRIELRQEDREACTKVDYFNSSIEFSADLKSATVEDFEMLALTYNGAPAKNRLEFDTITIDDKVIRLSGINKNIPAPAYQDKNIYMNITMIGEAETYYSVELEWNVLDSSNSLYTRTMNAKLYK